MLIHKINLIQNINKYYTDTILYFKYWNNIQQIWI